MNNDISGALEPCKRGERAALAPGQSQPTPTKVNPNGTDYLRHNIGDECVVIQSPSSMSPEMWQFISGYVEKILKPKEHAIDKAALAAGGEKPS